jgi:hypothetical protein
MPADSSVVSSLRFSMLPTEMIACSRSARGRPDSLTICSMSRAVSPGNVRPFNDSCNNLSPCLWARNDRVSSPCPKWRVVLPPPPLPFCHQLQKRIRHKFLVLNQFTWPWSRKYLAKVWVPPQRRSAVWLLTPSSNVVERLNKSTSGGLSTQKPPETTHRINRLHNCPRANRPDENGFQEIPLTLY